MVCLLVLVERTAGADDALKRKAEAAAQGGNYQRATILYRSLLDRDPQPEYLLELARCYRKLNDKQQAVVHYQKYVGIISEGAGAKEAQTYLAMNGEQRTQQVEPTRAPPPLVAQQADDSEGAHAPPAAAPSTYNPGSVYPVSASSYAYNANVPWGIQEKVRKWHVNVCGDESGSWKFCEVGGRNRSENDFIKRYARFTGSSELNHCVTPHSPIGFSVVGGLSAVSTIMLGAGFGLAFSGQEYNDAGRRTSRYINGLDVAITGAAILSIATVFGWPFTVFQPRTQHNIQREQADRLAKEYNRGLERTYGLTQ